MAKLRLRVGNTFAEGQPRSWNGLGIRTQLFVVHRSPPNLCALAEAEAGESDAHALHRSSVGRLAVVIITTCCGYYHHSEGLTPGRGTSSGGFYPPSGHHLVGTEIPQGPRGWGLSGYPMGCAGSSSPRPRNPYHDRDCFLPHRVPFGCLDAGTPPPSPSLGQPQA